MEKQTNTDINQAPFNPELAKEVLNDLKDAGINIESDIHWNEDIFREKLTAAEVATLIREQNYIDYINPLASTMSKTTAYIIDLATILTLTFCVVSVVLLSFKTALPQLNAAIYSNTLTEIIAWSFSLIYLGYFSFLESRYFSTIGKHFIGLKTINQLGHPLTVTQSLIRTFISIITLGNRHDDIMSTKVVRA